MRALRLQHPWSVISFVAVVPWTRWWRKDVKGVSSYLGWLRRHASIWCKCNAVQIYCNEFEFDLGVFSIIITVSSVKQPQIKCCHVLFCHFRKKRRGGLGLFILDPRTMMLPFVSTLSNFLVCAILMEDFGICKWQIQISSQDRRRYLNAARKQIKM